MSRFGKNITVPLVVTDGIVDKNVKIYHADEFSDPPNHARIEITGTYESGAAFRFDYAMSELNLTDQQLAMVMGAAQAACTAIFALEGFVAE